MGEARWPYFPVFLKLAGEPVLVVGGGEIALRKIRLLLKAGADVGVVARGLHPELAGLVKAQRLRRVADAFEPAQLRGCALAIAATDDAPLNGEVAAAGKSQGVPVNVVDSPAASRFIVPSIVDRSPVLVAISSGGLAPVLARRLREQVEVLLPATLGRLAAFFGARRARVKANAEDRRRVWEAFLDGPGAERALQGDEAGADAELERVVSAGTGAPRGEVYLVGAGPGDPDLLTFRAVRLMQQADVVLHDRLVPERILDLVRRDAERVFVGKGPKQHEMSQQEINALLVKLAREGKRVLRLKGGDPFIFGRGGEEIESLAAEGIGFQVVPGITAANGCSAYAGIPLTHRDYAQSVIFATGHARQGGELALDWPLLARRGQTVVFYMGRQSLPQLCEQLQRHGLPADWPAALVEQGTVPEQRVFSGTLADLPARAEAAQAGSPSLLIVGEVVKLRDRLRWFGPRGDS